MINTFELTEPLIILIGFVTAVVIISLFHAVRPRKKPDEEKEELVEIKSDVSVIDIPFHPDDLIRSKTYIPEDVAKQENIEYYPSLSLSDIIELKKLGIDARSATKKWVKAKSLDHLTKEEVFIMLRDSYWWENYWKHRPFDYLVFKGMKWVFKKE